LGETARIELTLTSPFDSNRAQARFVLPPGVSLLEGALSETFSLAKQEPHRSLLTIHLDRAGVQQIIGGGTMEWNRGVVGNWAELYLDVSESGTVVMMGAPAPVSVPNPQPLTPAP
jgi:hypothetical protein